MRGKKYFVIGAAVLIILATTAISSTTIQKKSISKDMKINDEEPEEYIIKKLPIWDNNRENATEIARLPKEEFEELMRESKEIVDNDKLTYLEKFHRANKLIQRYGILIEETNLEKLLNLEPKDNKNSIPLTLPQESPYIRFGPTVFIYASFFSQYTFIGDPTIDENISYFNITRLYDKINNFFNTSHPIFDYTRNISVGEYARWVPWQIGIGGSIGIFVSRSLIESKNYYVFGPFLGVFISPIFAGVYVYLEYESSKFPGGSFEIPIFDFMVGTPMVFSIVTPGWYLDPNLP